MHPTLKGILFQVPGTNSIFDKIVIVCDFHNIRNIFHHRYGSEVDFIGYINKFYSSDVYIFDNKEAIIKVIRKIFKLLTLKAQNEDLHDYFGTLYFDNLFLESLIQILIKEGFISLRTIMRQPSREISYHFEEVTFADRNYTFQAFKVGVVVQLKLLKDFIGDFPQMEKCFENIVFTDFFADTFRRTFGELIYVLSMRTPSFSNHQEFFYRFDGKDIVVIADRSYSNDALWASRPIRTRTVVKTDEWI